MSATLEYSEATGRIINAYVETACARAVAIATRTNYDQQTHARASLKFDRLIAQLDDADDLLTYLDDWFSGGNEIVIRQSRAPLSSMDRVEERNIEGRLVDVLYVFEPGSEDDTPGECVSDALRESRSTSGGTSDDR